ALRAAGRVRLQRDPPLPGASVTGHGAGGEHPENRPAPEDGRAEKRPTAGTRPGPGRVVISSVTGRPIVWDSEREDGAAGPASTRRPILPDRAREDEPESGADESNDARIAGEIPPHRGQGRRPSRTQADDPLGPRPLPPLGPGQRRRASCPSRRPRNVLRPGPLRQVKANTSSSAGRGRWASSPYPGSHERCLSDTGRPGRSPWDRDPPA